jgi:hypothetical protein
MSEGTIIHDIRIALAMPDVRLFRNQVGALEDKRGRWVQFGLCEGSSDLIGWRSVIATPDMVGQRVAIFTAIEVKTPNGRTEKERLAEQERFVNTVLTHGGLAGFAHNVPEARRVLTARY